MSDTVEQFIEELGRSVSEARFIKLTLGNYRGTEQHLQKVLVRLIETKSGRRLSFQKSYERQQTVKNHGLEDGLAEVGRLLGSGFRSGHLFTTSHDVQLTIGKKNSRMVNGRPTFAQIPSTAHDRQKATPVDPNAHYLKVLGITTEEGRVRAQQRDKWRQITRFVEILRDLIDASSLTAGRRLRIVDMGSGKGYLTFAAYDYLANVRGLNVTMTGVESRPELVDLCNQVAEASAFEGLKFVAGDIVNFDIGEIDILIALHACDTATDDALFKGIKGRAEIIVAAPCCHNEVRKQIKSPEVLKDILKHRTMLEREAETITDGLRAMLLERSGYSTRVFEFVPTEHTPKNNMIVATRNHARRADSGRLQEEIEAIKAFYGIENQRLETLMA